MIFFSSVESTGYKFLFIECNLTYDIINSLAHHSVTLFTVAKKKEPTQQPYKHPMAIFKMTPTCDVWIMLRLFIEIYYTHVPEGNNNCKVILCNK